MSGKRTSFSLFVLSSVAVLSGCATKIAGLKQSPTFTHQAITSGKIAVGGVVSATAILDEGRSTTYSNLMRTQLLEERKDYNVAPVGVLVNKVGRAGYQALAAEMQSTGTLSDASVALLKRKMPDTRYVAFARIEHDEVNHNRNESSQTDKNGQVVPGSERVTASSERQVSASLHIYDLKAGDVAFTGTVSKSASDSRSYEKEKDLALVSVIKAIKGDETTHGEDQKYPFPPAPDTTKVLAKIFAGFGENLPEKN